MHRIFKLLFHRVTVFVLLMLVQIAILLVMILGFSQYFVHFYGICVLISLLIVLYLVNDSNTNPAYKIAWILPITLVPFLGGLFYLMFGRSRLTLRERRHLGRIGENIHSLEPPSGENLRRLAGECPQAAVQAHYLQNFANAPLYRNTTTEYLPMGEIKLQRMLEELEKAEHYIFMEYFIIEEGVMWSQVLSVLERKAKDGLDVRVLYDDFGCLMTLPSHYKRTLEQKGIQCQVFNRFKPVLSSRFNNRDHRKICVIDGHTGFTGGINLADEYINARVKHGHWKDTALLMKGEGVFTLTAMFLSMWDFTAGIEEDYAQFYPERYHPQPFDNDGYVQPYGDSPLDDERVGENVYLNLIEKAERYVWITSPYLIISSEMVTALCTAAKGGVDVRIVTPHIADKWYVHGVTRSYYETLIAAGVKIYEYTPGFIHAKTFLVDDVYGVVGTINLDYRSLYLHFECAVWMFGSSCLKALKADDENLFPQCQQITLEQCRRIAGIRRFGRGLLRLFAPLM